MDFIHTLMNVVFAPLSLIALVSFLPTYLFFGRLLSTLRSIFSEDVAGKVALITGASSGIGEHLAYEYAKRRACLALVARREYCLREVGAKAEMIGSPEAIVVPGEVRKRLFAIPRLKISSGRIVVTASCASWLPIPRMAFYNATKAALVAMYETLRVEMGSEIGITIVNPGLIESEITAGKFVDKQRKVEFNRELREVQVNIIPLESAERCAKAIVKGACRGEKYLTEPSWYREIFFWKVFCPNIVEWTNLWYLIPGRGRSERDAVSKKIHDLVTKVKECLTFGMGTVEFPENSPSQDDGSLVHHTN